MEEQKEVFQQDLSQEGTTDEVFVIALLMKEPSEFPDKDHMLAVLEKRLGGTECFWYSEKGAGFAAKKYLCQFQDGAVMPPQVILTPCVPFEADCIDAFRRSQMWECMEDRDRILSECRYQVVATDMLAAALPARERAALDMDFLEAVVELYPACEAVYLHNCGKLILAQEIREHQVPWEDRFIRFAVNARLFNIQDTHDMLVDTVGMGTLNLPDLQYHFHGMDPNWVVNHACCTASYLLANDNPIQPGDPIDGVVDGALSREVMWKCEYEEAMIQPARGVIDVYMNEYAAGQRTEENH